MCAYFLYIFYFFYSFIDKQQQLDTTTRCHFSVLTISYQRLGHHSVFAKLNINCWSWCRNKHLTSSARLVIALDNVFAPWGKIANNLCHWISKTALFVWTRVTSQSASINYELQSFNPLRSPATLARLFPVPAPLFSIHPLTQYPLESTPSIPFDPSIRSIRTQACFYPTDKRHIDFWLMWVLGSSVVSSCNKQNESICNCDGNSLIYSSNMIVCVVIALDSLIIRRAVVDLLKEYSVFRTVIVIILLSSGTGPNTWICFSCEKWFSCN